MKTVLKTPVSCKICQGSETAKTLFDNFSHDVDYGHAYCRKCGITFDTNIHQIEVRNLEKVVISDLDEKEYRSLFVESSRISDTEGKIYPKFEWTDNDAVKSGIASRIAREIEKHTKSDVFSLLDLGAGDGFISVELSKRFPQSTIYSVDPSPLVKRLESMPSIIPHQGTIDTAPIPAGTLSFVTIIGNLMLHANPDHTLKRCNELMCKNAVIVLDYKNVNSASRIIARRMFTSGLGKKLGRKLWERNFVNMRYGFTRAYVSDLLSANGFVIVDTSCKPPRLLEFSNKSQFQKGIKGAVWRILDHLDQLRDEQAWIQVTAIKKEPVS